MKNPNIEKLIEYNEMRAKQSLEIKDYNHYHLCRGWTEALNYITNNYKLEEK